ncbi:hypothetical protein [Erythrobacter sp.]|uniref:hypothetical protein n=1 Tax=Erythrobacter sp. TaxID=1042 RepID=UPI001425BEC8|nr:hypothetical protein [Erythrobacter sp.]QIQ85619.1 MAG: hypothetical protein G9473_02155 [Erythrobacter sp.]
MAKAALPLLSLFAAAPALAQPQPQPKDSVAFTIDGQAYEFALPEDFCLPDARQQAVARSIAALDPQNDTMVHVYHCAPDNEDYIIVKVQKQRQRLPWDNATFLEMAEQHFSSEFGRAMLEDEAEEAGSAVNRGAEGQMKISGSTMGYAGRDAVCAYLRGVTTVEDAGGAVTVRSSSCMTLKGGYLLAVHAYGLAEEGTEFDLLARRSLAAAEGIEVRAAE